MISRLSRRAFVGAATVTLATPAVLRAAEPLKFRWSLDTAPSHPRNVAVVDYVGKLEKATNGALVGEVFHSGQLFPDLNVSKALLQGQVEMGGTRRLDADWPGAGCRHGAAAVLLRPVH